VSWCIALYVDFSHFKIVTRFDQEEFFVVVNESICFPSVSPSPPFDHPIVDLQQQQLVVSRLRSVNK